MRGQLSCSCWSASTTPKAVSANTRISFLAACANVSWLPWALPAILADEPTTALDVTIQAQILELLRDLSRRLGIAVVLITHKLEVYEGQDFTREDLFSFCGECGEPGPHNWRHGQEADIRYVVTSLEGDPQHLYEDVYCMRGQTENLIKIHKAQLASDRTSCHSATPALFRNYLQAFDFQHKLCADAAAPRMSRFASGLQIRCAAQLIDLQRTMPTSIPAMAREARPTIRHASRGRFMNQQYGKQAFDQTDKLFQDLLAPGNLQVLAEQGVAAS